MILFWFIAALMIAMALWFILPALLQVPADKKSDHARAANLLVYQDQLRESHADLDAGLLTEAQYEQDREELERRLLEDVGDSNRGRKRSHTVPRKLAYAIAVAIPLVAIAFYLLLANPKGLDPNAVNSPAPITR